MVASLAATVVVEAGIRSGSMSAAQRAHELAHAHVAACEPLPRRSAAQVAMYAERAAFAFSQSSCTSLTVGLVLMYSAA